MYFVMKKHLRENKNKWQVSISPPPPQIDPRTRILWYQYYYIVAVIGFLVNMMILHRTILFTWPIIL